MLDSLVCGVCTRSAPGLCPFCARSVLDTAYTDSISMPLVVDALLHGLSGEPGICCGAATPQSCFWGARDEFSFSPDPCTLNLAKAQGEGGVPCPLPGTATPRRGMVIILHKNSS